MHAPHTVHVNTTGGSVARSAGPLRAECMDKLGVTDVLTFLRYSQAECIPRLHSAQPGTVNVKMLQGGT